MTDNFIESSCKESDPLFEAVDIAAARDQIGLFADAADEDVVGFDMGVIAIEIETVIEQLVGRGTVCRFLQRL